MNSLFEPSFKIPVKAFIERFPSGKLYKLRSADSSASFSQKDFQDIAQVCNEPLIYNTLFKKMFDGKPYTPQDSEGFIKMAKDGWDHNNKFIFLIRDPDNKTVGAVDIKTPIWKLERLVIGVVRKLLEL